MLISVDHGPSSTDMELAKTALPDLDNCQTQEQFIVETHLAEKIKTAQTKLAKFNSHILGIVAIHPEVNPINWPGPYGQNVSKPDKNVLREVFDNLKRDPSKLYNLYIYQVNRFMLHKCRMGYCLDHKRVKVKKSKGPDGKEVQKRIPVCRFNHPMDISGFDYSSDENGKLQYVHPKLDDNGDLQINGSFYDDGKLTLLRNHPDIVTHIPELVVLWGANTDQKIVTEYQQLLNYLLKYILKNETKSDFLTNIAKTVSGKLDESNDKKARKLTTRNVMMNSVGKRDMSLNECMLICHNKPYVQYSKTPRLVSLKGSTMVKSKIALNDDAIVTKDNWQEAYWQ